VIKIFPEESNMDEKECYDVLVVDDHPIVCDAIVNIVGTSTRMRVCGQTGNANEVIGLISRLRPDAVILDLSLESSDGFDLIMHINKQFPNVLILVLSMHNELTHAVRCIQSGARGYLMKNCEIKEILFALHEIFDGKIYTSEFVKNLIICSYAKPDKKYIHHIDILSQRELEVFRFYGKGFKRSQIASILQCSPKTIETHTVRIRKKLNIKTVNELIANAGAFVTSVDIDG
jgi:DNA-binding NarL/FixJ family response regulator